MVLSCCVFCRFRGEYTTYWGESNWESPISESTWQMEKQGIEPRMNPNGRQWAGSRHGENLKLTTKAQGHEVVFATHMRRPFSALFYRCSSVVITVFVVLVVPWW